ncbi:cobalt ABC transporter ATP-binding protein [Rubrobacter xylanophilus]|uniref:Cobalt ABC transporter ATP-binding protein n=1 Tax=Rubrobacter xylanophilus TaxID=49319 RepID=A0A510HLT5_9ACTN|nr:ATP-binding cassette domain-containing protein [Rubrobacter xylanophilus]BBL79553.1 cobalt ABC transporter ATP-binding protein [Rubrobacter xylanophilus]
MRLELWDVRHVYAPGTPREVEALRGVSLVVEPGEVLGIVGGTGSGKSTLAQHMNLLLEPTSGRVLVDGRDAREMRRPELRRRVGLVFQFPEAALFASTVEEDVAFAPRRMGLPEEEVRRRVRRALELFGAAHLAGRSPHALSGGEKRRVAIAGVLAMEPEVLVLDEPTAGLDPATRAELLEAVLGVRRKGSSVVFISHDLDEVAEVADRVCLLESGRVVACGLPEEVFYAHPEAAPAAVRVVRAVRREYPRLGRPVRLEDACRVLRGLLAGG